MNFTFAGNYDVSQIISKLDSITDQDWKEFDFRQRTFRVHALTLSIPILFDENFTNNPKKYRFYELFENEADRLTDFFKNIYGPGKLVRFLLVKLLANAKIPTHVDGGPSLMDCRRHHIAVITNPNVTFVIGNETKNLKLGEVWEIDNSKPHNVSNNSNQDRIHIIADWLVEKPLNN